jgi:PAS domain S-box-containing protein
MSGSVDKLTLRETMKIWEALPDIVFVFDIQHLSLSYHNDGIREILGYTAGDLNAPGSILIPTLVHPDDLVFLTDGLQRISQAPDNETAEIEVRLRHANGEWRWLRCRIRVFSRDSAGEVQQIIGTAQDVTSQHRRDEGTARENEAQLQKLIHASPVAMLIAFSLDGRVEYVNRQFTQLFGYTIEDIPNVNDWWACAYPDEAYRQHIRGQWTQQVEMAAQSGTDVGPVEATVICKDGSTCYVECRRASIGEKHVVTFIDLTRHRLMEEALRESEHRHSIVSDLMWNYACSYRYLSDDSDEAQLEWVVGAFEEVTGHRIEDAFSGFSLSQPVHPEDVHMFQERQRRLHSGHPEVTEFRILNKRGEIRWLRSFGRPEWDEEHQRVVRVYIGVQDITERKRAEEQTTELRLQGERLRMLTEFINNAAHDLRTPLSVMTTNLYLYRKLPDPAQKEERIQIVEKQIGHMARLVDRLVIMARLEGAASLEHLSLDLNQIVGDVRTVFEPAAAKKQIQLTFDADKSQPRIEGDSFYLACAFNNLIENAIQYTPENGQVTLRTYIDGRFVVLEVCDTGIGISADDLPHIFEHFFKANRARTSDETGSGMGLTIAERVVVLHGGQITVESAPGQGSVFRVRLPLSEA